MSKQNPRLDPAGPLRAPEQAMSDNDELRLVQYRREDNAESPRQPEGPSRRVMKWADIDPSNVVEIEVGPMADVRVKLRDGSSVTGLWEPAVDDLVRAFDQCPPSLIV